MRPAASLARASSPYLAPGGRASCPSSVCACARAWRDALSCDQIWLRGPLGFLRNRPTFRAAACLPDVWGGETGGGGGDDGRPAAPGEQGGRRVYKRRPVAGTPSPPAGASSGHRSLTDSRRQATGRRPGGWAFGREGALFGSS